MGIFDFFKKKENNDNEKKVVATIKSKENIPQDVMVSGISKLAELFSKDFGNSKHQLDFSDKSIYIIDELIEQSKQETELWNKIPKEEFRKQAGSYFFEVCRRNYGGKYLWNKERNQTLIVVKSNGYEFSTSIFDKLEECIEYDLDNTNYKKTEIKDLFNHFINLIKKSSHKKQTEFNNIEEEVRYTLNDDLGKKVMICSVKSNMTGNQALDNEIAFKKAGFTDEALIKKTLEYYTWHYLDDMDPISTICTMQLVLTEVLEKTKPFTDGRDLWEKFFELKYENIE